MKTATSVALLAASLSLCFACDDKYKQIQQQAAASASAAAAASAAALSVALASASAAPTAKVRTPAGEWITCQHVLIAYKGAKNAPYSVTRTKEDARKRAQEADAKAKDPTTEFEDVVMIYSDDISTKERRGSLGKVKRDGVVKDFGDAAWQLDVDEVSGVVETPFGFHIIKRNQ